MSACPFCKDIGADIIQDRVDKIFEINKHQSAPSSSINNAIATSMALVDILHYFSGKIENINSLNKRLGIKNSNFEKVWIDMTKNERCDVCGKLPREKR